ncbi:hypothetical protein Pla22_32760 [Rubripirellula amarantea]|uniref:Uncharacterized protein n=1 Tax=Rubripirellula amarantea TaxID=2527999 RepID=A0A5C5WKN7_9BACT|nr:hypothetical protein Pla22_32760 [Rubripirellula amarantea]
MLIQPLCRSSLVGVTIGKSRQYQPDVPVVPGISRGNEVWKVELKCFGESRHGCHRDNHGRLSSSF